MRFPGILFLFALAAASSAHGQGYPSKPVRVVVPFPAGGTDVTARIKIGRARV